MALAKGKPTTPEPPKLTLRAFFKDFLTDARIRLSPTTVERYKYSFKALMYDLGDFLPVASLTNQALNRWAASLLEKGRSPEGVNFDLRHTCFIWLVGKGVPLKLVQDIAGHSTITTTMRYAKIFTGNAHEVLEKAFGF